MTHGDKAKAKTGKGSSQTSGKKVSKAVEAKAGGKDKSGKGLKTAGAKQQAGSEKAAAAKKGSAPAAKEVSSAGSDAKAKARTTPQPGESSGFANAVVGSAFRHALKKYPNAFRRLTD